MQSWNSPGWGWRLLLCIALALFFLHAVVLMTAPSKSATLLISDSIQVAFGLLATAATVHASRRTNRFGRHFWLLISACLLLWTAAQSMATYYNNIEHLPLQTPWPSDVVFFVCMAPAFMALFLDTERGLELKNWPRILDLVQVVILIAAAHLLLFAPPEHWKMGEGALARLAWLPDTGRDVLLVGAFSLRALMSRQRQARDLYGRMAIFFALYLAGEVPYLYLQSTRNLQPATPWDLAWTFPFLALTILAATPGALPEAAGGEDRTRRKEDYLGRWGLIHVVPMIFPLVVLLMAAGIAERQLAVASVMVVTSFACSSARIIFSERQRRQSDLALEEKNALLKSVFEGTGDAVYIKDLEGRYVIVNPAFAKYFEKPAEQIARKTAAQLFDFATARRLSETDRLVIETGRAQTFEYELPLVHGTRAFLVMKSPYQDGQGKTIGVIVVSRDITEYRAMEERLRQSQKMEAIGTLAGGVAHDFNNLLMVIAGYSSVLNEALAGEPKLRGQVEQIQKAGERAAALTRQLLAFSRKQTIQPVPLNLNTAVTGVEKLLRRLIGENIAITTRLEPEIGVIKADAGQIEQVILNLAVNARDAMPDGGKLTLETRHTEIGVGRNGQSETIKPGRYVELSVGDTGIGMDPQDSNSHI